MPLKRTKNTSVFLRNIFGSNNSLTLIENNFEIAKFESKVTVHYGLWAKCTQLWALNQNYV